MSAAVEDGLASEMAEVADLFDADFYRAAHPTLSGSDDDLLRHFCQHGWRELRKPRRDFDVWWYWANHLDPAVEAINPLLHFVRVGQAAGLSTRPDPTALSEGVRPPHDRPVRRACLFAAYDVDGQVDESVVAYLRELARFCDVFCLYDHYLPATELARLSEVTVGAWGIRHGAYDFGSYSRLARELVGWDRLAEYDEVLFVNDSCYLLRPLDEVFARMDAESCDWWGLQATKGLAITRGSPHNVFQDPIPMSTVRRDLLPAYEDDEIYDFHLGSYFLAFRRPVLDDPVFRRLIDSIAPQPGKLRIIQKYEIGIAHVLLGRGHSFSSFVPDLYPFHPMFTEWAFELIDRGFPLLKKLLLYLNHYDVPDLAAWRDRVAALVPEAPLDLYETNLLRSTPDDQLRRAQAITRGRDGAVDVPQVLVGAAFVEADKARPKRPDQWVFAVDPLTQRLPENSRAIFEQVAQDPAITKIVLTRSRRVDLPGRAVVSHPLLSPDGREALLGAGVVFVPDRPKDTLGDSISRARHLVIAVRRGLMLMRHGATAASPRAVTARRPPDTGSLEMLHPVRRRSLTAILTASAIDQIAEIAAQFPARYGDAWRTGLPYHDLLVAAELPADLAAQEARVRDLLQGRRLMLFAPEGHGPALGCPAYDFTGPQLDELAAWADRHDAVIGIREPVGDLSRPYSRQFGDRAIDLSPQRVPATSAVLRASDALLTDYSGLALDFTVTDRPVLSFAPDLDLVADRMLYDLDHMFPGPVVRSFDALLDALEGAFEPDAATRRQHERVRDLLIEEPDGASGPRVIDRLQRLLAEEAA